MTTQERPIFLSEREIVNKDLPFLAEKLLGCFDFQVEERNMQKIDSLLQLDYRPIIYANHQSHADIFGLFGVISIIRKRCNYNGNFLVPFAASVESGDQGSFIKNFYKLIKPMFSDKGIEFISVVRREDEERYNLNPSSEGAMKLLRTNEGICILPEATTKGGRFNPETNSIYGMIEVKDGLAGLLVQRMKRGKDTVMIPVGINGSYNLFRSPINVRQVTDSVKVVAKSLLTKNHLVETKIGYPFTTEELVSQFNNEDLDKLMSAISRRENTDAFERINQILMYQVADLLPEEARGIYRR